MQSVSEHIRDHISEQIGFAMEPDLWHDFDKPIAYEPRVVGGVVCKKVNFELAGIDIIWSFVNRANEHGKPVDAVRKKLLETTGD